MIQSNASPSHAGARPDPPRLSLEANRSTKPPVAGMTSFYAQVAAQTARAMHCHDVHELFVCTNGAGWQAPGGVRIRQRRGDIFCFPAGMLHYACGAPSANGHVVMISGAMFHPELYGDRDTHQTLQRVIRLATRGRNPLPVSPETAGQVLRLAGELTREIGSGDPGYQAAARSLLQNLFLRLMRDPGIRCAEAPCARNTRHEERIARVRQHLDAHFMEAIRVRQIALLAGMSRSSLHAAFRHVAGCTLVEYVTQVRVRAATRRLRDSDDTVMQVAMDCGFATMSRFYDAFRRLTGKTPREIRVERS